MQRAMHRRTLASILLLPPLAASAWGLWNARADPVVRRVSIGLPDWPAGAAPVRAVVLADIHIGNLAMGPRRLTRIVGQVNKLAPDIVLIPGDFIAGSAPGFSDRPASQLIAPLAAIRARYGTVATLGNHDEWTGPGAVRGALARAGVTLLDNGAVARGPLRIGGVDDPVTRHDDLARTGAALERLPGAGLLLAHDYNGGWKLHPDQATLVIAGHTHCGQINLPWHRPRAACGPWSHGWLRFLVTGGLGTSIVPLRYFTPPDVWLLTLGPARRHPRRTGGQSRVAVVGR